MLNVIFNDFSYELLPKQRETWERYCKIIQWARRHPTRFVEDFLNLQLTDYQKYIFLNSWIASTAVILCSRGTGKATSLDTKVYSCDDEGKLYSKLVGELKLGDKIYDSTGRLTEVIHLNPIIFDNYYEIVFEDGEKIKCNQDHLWLIYDSFSAEPDDVKLVSTESIVKLFQKNKDVKLFVPVCKQFQSTLDFKKAIQKVTKFNKKIPMRCITVDNEDGTFLCGENFTVTHNSFFSAPFVMTRSLLIPNHKTYIMSVSGGQASATFSKLEDLANNNIASAIGVSSVFLENVVKGNSKISGFTHGKEGMHVELFNGSEVTSLNSVPQNLRGTRSNLNKHRCSLIWKQV